MSQTDILITLGSALAVALLVGVAALLGFRSRARIADDAQLRALILEAEPGAALTHMIRDRDGRAGLARLSDGRWAAAASVGDRIAVRLFPRAQIARATNGVRARFGDAGFPGVTLRLDAPAPDWLVGGGT